tara:strand:- start:891 stop:1370 length:480 start_codon:yes stop_codon:yes gene_type:complete
MNLKYITQITLSLFSFYILYSTYNYLDQLKTCACFVENQHPKYKVNIEFLKLYQILEIFALFIFVIMLTMYKHQLFGGAKNKAALKFFLLISTVLLLFITGYVSAYSILLFLTSKEDCLCVNQWQKYIIYIQGTFNTIYFLRIAYMFVFLFLLFAFNKK